MEHSLEIVPRDLGARRTAKGPIHLRQQFLEFIHVEGVQPLKGVSNWNWCTSLSVGGDGSDEIHHAAGVGSCLYHAGSVFAQKQGEGLIVARDRDGAVLCLIEHLTGAPIQIRGRENLVSEDGSRDSHKTLPGAPKGPVRSIIRNQRVGSHNYFEFSEITTQNYV